MHPGQLDGSANSRHL